MLTSVKGTRERMDVRRSRRDRLASIPPDHLLLMAREWVIGFNNQNTSAAHVTKVLESAAARGSEESGWLQDKLRSKGDIPEFGDDLTAKRRWVAEIMATEDSPRGQYYRGVALLCPTWSKDAGLERGGRLNLGNGERERGGGGGKRIDEGAQFPVSGQFAFE